MRIAIITSGYRPALDGTSIVVHERCRRLSAWGHDVLVVGPDYEPVATHYPDWRRYLGEILPKVQVVRVPSKPFFGVEWERNPTRRANGALAHHLETFRPDVIHVDEPERLTYGYCQRPGLAYARRRGIPAAAFYHTNYVDYGPDFIPLPGLVMRALQAIVKPVVAAVYNAYDATLVPSATTAAKLRAYGLRNIVEGAFNGMDYRRFSAPARTPGFFAQRYGLLGVDERVKLLFVGRLTPDKGWAFAMRALPTLAREASERIAVLVAGAGEMREEIECELRARLDCVHFFGHVQPEDMPEIYANADVHVSCSQKENYGLTAVEAMAAGIPAVTPRAGGFIDTVLPGRNGATYTPDSAPDFTRTLLPFVYDPALRSARGAQGRQFAMELDWDVTIANWLDAVRHCYQMARLRPGTL